MKKLSLLIVLLPLFVFAQNSTTLEVGSFNIEWFPCKDDGEMMKQYGINLRYPPEGNATDTTALFALLKELDIELLGVQEIVDTKLFGELAKRHLGEEFEFVYAPGGGDQKVGFLYDSSVLELVGTAEMYSSVQLSPDSRLRPALRGYFKTKPDGFDFHAIVLHLKASPRGWDLREQQWNALEEILSELPEKTGDADIILVGDMNNVTDRREEEFMPLMRQLGYHWASGEAPGLPTNYWQPDWKVQRIQESAIDHIMVSGDAKVEYVENSIRVGGMCAADSAEYVDNFPDYYNNISDHCPVFATFEVGEDND